MAIRDRVRRQGLPYKTEARSTEITAGQSISTRRHYHLAKQGLSGVQRDVQPFAGTSHGRGDGPYTLTS